MGFFKRKAITEETIARELENAKYRLNSTHDSMVDVEFRVTNFRVTQRVDVNNFEGVVSYVVDTEYGGGPGNFDTTFEVVDGKLSIELNDVDWDNLLDMSIIDEQTDADYGDGVLDSEDDWDY